MQFKETSHNSYRYVVTAATWAGASWRTTITIENDQVIGRDFQYDVFDNIPMPPGGWTAEKAQEMVDKAGKTMEEYIEMTGHPLLDVLQWTETAENVGTHENTSAAGIRTLDEIYELARTLWLKKRSDGCQDDCFSGISIAAITAL